MDVHTTADAAAFLDEVGPWLLDRIDHNHLLYNVAMSIRDIPGYCADPWLAVAREGGSPVLAAVRTPPRAVLVGGGEVSALPALAAALRASSPQVPGAAGPRGVIEGFGEAWAPGAWREFMALRLYRLDAVAADPRRPEGALRQATPADASLLARWIQGFRDDAHLRDPEPVDVVAERMIALGGTWFFEVGGEPVSSVAGRERVPGTAHVGMVYTPPALRGRGYGSAATAALTRQLLDAGARATFLFTDLANPTSNSIYQRIGYRAVCDYAHLEFPESP